MPITKEKKSRKKEPTIKVPLSAIRCILGYPRERKIVCEIDTKGITRLNKPNTLDEIINEARFDYALGNYKTFTKAKNLIAELRA